MSKNKESFDKSFNNKNLKSRKEEEFQKLKIRSSEINQKKEEWRKSDKITIKDKNL